MSTQRPSPWPAGAALLFDLDGTLVDTAPDLAGTLNALLVREGLAPLPLDDVRHLVGHGARALLKQGLESQGRTLAPANLDALVSDFIDHYADRIADESAPFPGLLDSLAAFARAGIALGVVTNKREKLARLLLDRLDMSRHFGAVFGGDTAARPKPHPDPIEGAIRALGADTAHTIMIGDSETDINAAKAAGVPVIAVKFGYSAAPIDTLGADILIDHFSQLPGAVARLWGLAEGQFA